MVRNWAHLPQELLQLCSQHLCPKDFWAFRAVCRSWRSASLEERSNVPWLMLMDQKETRWRKFFCLSCQRVHEVLMSKAKAKRCFSSQGWVLALSRDWELYLLKNPMSRHSYIIKLPHLSKFPHIKNSSCYDDFAAKFALSASPTTSLDYMVMVLCRGGQLGLWKPGDKEWTEVNYPTHRYAMWDLIFYKGYFFALDCEGSILRCDVNGPTPFEAQLIFELPRKLVDWDQPDLVQPTTGYPMHLRDIYLVSTTGSLLFVSQWEGNEPDRTFRFKVFGIDLNTQTCTEVKSLGNTSLFLGPNSSFSLEVDEKHHIKPNCIYFYDGYLSIPQLSEEGGRTDMGIYHIEDWTTELYCTATSCDLFSPPLWIKSSF